MVKGISDVYVFLARLAHRRRPLYRRRHPRHLSPDGWFEYQSPPQLDEVRSATMQPDIAAGVYQGEVVVFRHMVDTRSQYRHWIIGRPSSERLHRLFHNRTEVATGLRRLAEVLEDNRESFPVLLHSQIPNGAKQENDSQMTRSGVPLSRAGREGDDSDKLPCCPEQGPE